jgi:hypothetical protein
MTMQSATSATIRPRSLGSPRKLWLPVFAISTVVVVSGCGGSSSKAAAQAPAPAASGGAASGGAAQGAGTGTGQRPGTTGTISAVNPSSIFVQSTQEQVTVNFSATTKFSQTVAATAAAVKVGACVTATAASTASAAPSAAPSAAASRAPVTALTATAVTITSASGTCTGANGFGGNRTGVAPSARPSNQVRPSGAPGGTGRGNFGGFGETAFGKVASVSGDTFVVTETRGGTSTTPAKITVTTTAATTYRQDATATSASLKVGLCATAIGKTDDTGAVAATTIALSTATSTGCTTGLGGGFGGRNGGTGNGGGTAG